MYYLTDLWSLFVVFFVIFNSFLMIYNHVCIQFERQVALSSNETKETQEVGRNTRLSARVSLYTSFVL